MIISNLTDPLSIGASGFASDGAWHISMPHTFTWDRVRYSISIVVHGPEPFLQIGGVDQTLYDPALESYDATHYYMVDISAATDGTMWLVTAPVGSTVAVGDVWDFAESFAPGGDVFEGAFSSGVSVSSAASGKIGIGGSVSTSAGSASLSNSGVEGKQGPMSSVVADLIQALYGGSGIHGDASIGISQIGYAGAGNSGNTGTAALTIESLLSAVGGAIGSSGMFSTVADINMDIQGQEGAQGTITGSMSMSAALFGSFGDAQVIFEGSLGATLSEFESEISGGAGVGGAISTQIITMASTLSAIIGSSGSYTISLDNLAAYIDGLTGVSGQISASISSGADLASKIGISGEIVTSLDHLSLQLIEIVMSDRIYQIVISTKTGQAVFLAPKFGTIEMTTEN